MSTKQPKPPEKVVHKTNVAFFLVGIPGAGKTTFRKDLQDAGESKCGYSVVSTDDVIELLAIAQNKTYDELWKENIKEAEKVMDQYFDAAIDRGTDLIIDRTNMSKKSRARWLGGIPDYYNKIAVNFEIPPSEILEERLESRPGKTVPWSAIDDMIKKYQKPEMSEGFDEIITVKGW